MREIFEPWHHAMRAFVLQTPPRPKTAKIVFNLPEDLLPPVAVLDRENGFVALMDHLAHWPAERQPPTDLRHRLEKLPEEKFAAERAIQRLRPLLDGLDPILEMPQWYATIRPNTAVPSYHYMERLALALLIRAELDGNPEDRQRALAISRHMRGSKGGLAGFLKSIRLEYSAKAAYEDLQEDRAEAVRCELARLLIPRLPFLGPWDQPPYELPPDWADQRRAVQWLMSSHPTAYDAEATLKQLLAVRPLMESGTSVELRTAAFEIASPWPAEMRPQSGKVTPIIPLPVLYMARPNLRAMENPHGALLIGRWLNYAASAAEWMEYRKKTAKPQ